MNDHCERTFRTGATTPSLDVLVPIFGGSEQFAIELLNQWLVDRSNVQAERLLELCQVPHEATYEPFVTLEQARDRLGSQGLFEHMITLRVADLSANNFEASTAGSQAGRAFFEHSVIVGLLTEQLALQVYHRPHQWAFVAGLLHDMGKVVTGQYDGDLSQSTHAELGADLVQHWDLPTTVWDAVRYHHQPNEVPDGFDDRLARIVQRADEIARQLGFGEDSQAAQRHPSAAELDEFDLFSRVAVIQALGQLEQIVPIAWSEDHERAARRPNRASRPGRMAASPAYTEVSQAA